jgi:hypothetical protein
MLSGNLVQQTSPAITNNTENGILERWDTGRSNAATSNRTRRVRIAAIKELSIIIFGIWR